MNVALDHQAAVAAGDSPAVALAPPCCIAALEAKRPSVAARVASGTSVLGISVAIERGAGFLANILAARLGGAATFGAYSLAISTANQISTYAAGGIGATAARFSGKYCFGSPEYSLLARALMIVSIISAVLAALGLWAGAAPIAHLLGRPEFAVLLRSASLSAAAIVTLECARGFFVGQRRLAALVLLALLMGVPLACCLPVAARAHQPQRMILLQGMITMSAVAICLLLARPLGLVNRTGTPSASLSLRSMLREVASFGTVQLGGLVSANIAGWWLTTLIARSDTTLVEMSFFAIASQLRNLAGIAPGLLTEGSYAVMADPLGEASRAPQRVMEVCSFATTFVTFLFAATGMALVPWGLRMVYGSTYTHAAAAVATGLALAVVHMGNAPAAARLTIVSLRSTGLINTVWAVVVAGCATAFLFLGGDAMKAMGIYLGAHTLSAGLVLYALHRANALRRHMAGLFVISTAGVFSLLALAILRAAKPALTWPLTLAMAALSAAILFALFRMGRAFDWLPRRERLLRLVDRVRELLARRRDAYV